MRLTEKNATGKNTPGGKSGAAHKNKTYRNSSNAYDSQNMEEPIHDDIESAIWRERSVSASISGQDKALDVKIASL